MGIKNPKLMSPAGGKTRLGVLNIDDIAADQLVDVDAICLLSYKQPDKWL